MTVGSRGEGVEELVVEEAQVLAGGSRFVGVGGERIRMTWDCFHYGFPQSVHRFRRSAARQP